MAFNRFEFDPKDGFVDSDFYEDTPENAREILQRQHNQTRDYINHIVDTLNSDNLGISGSESIKSPAIEGVLGNDVFNQIKDIKRQINDVSLSSVPDGSITEEKMADKSVTCEKIRDGAITGEKFSPDAKIPMATETEYVNGILSKNYSPVYSNDSLGIIKNRVCDFKFSNTYGKIFNGKRYIIDDKKLKRFDIETGEVETVCEDEISEYSKIAVKNENEIYFANESIDDLSQYKTFTINIYRYEEEYKESILVNTIRLFVTHGYDSGLVDMDIWENTLYFTTYYYGNRIDLYKIDLDKIKDTEDLSPYYSYNEENHYYDNMQIRDGDLYVGTKVFLGREANNIKDIGANFVYCDSLNNLLVSHDSFIVIEKDTLLPKYIKTYNIDITDAFIENNHLFIYIDGYLFKTRLY